MDLVDVRARSGGQRIKLDESAAASVAAPLLTGYLQIAHVRNFPATVRDVI
jgi:hypothetical protein